MYRRTICKNMFLPFMIGSIFCAGLAGCGSSAQVTQAVVNETPELDVLPTETPNVVDVQSSKTPQIIDAQPSITPASITEAAPPPTPDYAVLANLRKELLYAGGGGGGSEDTGLRCEEPSPPPYSELPDIRSGCRFRDCMMDEDYTCDEDVYHLYLYGFPFDQEVQLELYNPTGEQAGRAVFIVEKFSAENNYGHIRQLEPRVPYDVSSTSATTRGEVEVLDVGLWLPGWQPTGEWYVVASAGDLSAEGSFSVQTPESFPNLYVVPGVFPSPFEKYQEYNFAAGQQFSIIGTGFQPEQTYALGIYYLARRERDINAELVVGTAVKANQGGNFSAQVEIEGSDPAGDYLAFVDFDPTHSQIAWAGVSARYSVEYWTPCSDGLLSYLGPRTSKHVRVNENSSAPATLMAEPSEPAKIIGQLQPGDGVFIMAGPECQDGMVWWFVENGDADQQGWMPEADAQQSWLETRQ